MGFVLFPVTLLPGILLNYVGAYSVWNLFYIIISAPGHLLPEKGHKTGLMIMFFWGYAGFLWGYFQDLLGVAEVKTIKRSYKNKNMTNLYNDRIIKNPDSKSKKNSDKMRELVIPVFPLLIILFMGAAVFFMFRPDILQRLVIGPPECSQCSKVETDAQNTLAALASYFSEPEHTEVPTVQELVHLEGLTLNKNSTVIIDGPGDEIRVTVIEKKNRCVRGNKYEVSMGGTAGEWYRE
jgi:hypothetical protein